MDSSFTIFERSFTILAQHCSQLHLCIEQDCHAFMPRKHRAHCHVFRAAQSAARKSWPVHTGISSSATECRRTPSHDFECHRMSSNVIVLLFSICCIFDMLTCLHSALTTIYQRCYEVVVWMIKGCRKDVVYLEHVVRISQGCFEDVVMIL